MWRLSIKDGSKHVISSDNEIPCDHPDWELVQQMSVLGHIVDYRCRLAPVVKRTLQQMWGVYFKRLANQRTWNLTLDQRIREVSRYIEPLLRYRSSGWPYYKKIADTVDAAQLKMLGQLLRVAPWPDEPLPLFSEGVQKVRLHLPTRLAAGRTLSLADSLLGTSTAYETRLRSLLTLLC
jgi:hypothetical protein